MTQIVKKEYPWSSSIPSLGKPPQELKERILNCLFRNFCFVSHLQKIRALTTQEIAEIAINTGISSTLVHSITSKFLINLIFFRKFLHSYQFTYKYTKSLRRLQLYLHKLHKIAPVFNYARAKENARILKNLLVRHFFLPQFSTQLAIVVFVTDINDKKYVDKIIQTNLRVFCDCSAYAFHRTRNRLGIE